MTECPICENMLCPYCGGPEMDYHTRCLDCECVQKSQTEQAMDAFVWGATAGVLGAMFGIVLD